MLMGTAVSAFAEDVMVAPIIDEAVEAVEEALGEEQDVKTLILNNLKQKMEHVGDALMSMKFDLDIDMALMGEAQAIKFNADLNAMSSGLDKVQIYGSAQMEMNGEAKNAPLDGYLVKAEEGKYAMYLKADEGWTKQTIDIGWEQYPNQHVVSMEELFIQLQKDPARNMVIDYKRVPIPMLADLIKQYNVGRQLTFACHNRALLREIKGLVPEIRTKNWLDTICSMQQSPPVVEVQRGDKPD